MLLLPDQVPEDDGEGPFQPVPRRRGTRGGGDTCRKQLGCQENSGKNIVADPLVRIHLIFSKILMFLPGGGLHSTPDWNLPGRTSQDVFRELRQRLFDFILSNSLHKEFPQ